MAHGDARVGKRRGNWRMEWVAITLHTTSEHGVSSITTANAHTSAASSRLNWRPCRFKWTCPFRRKTKSGFCACAITFELASALFYDAAASLSKGGWSLFQGCYAGFTAILIVGRICGENCRRNCGSDWSVWLVFGTKPSNPVITSYACVYKCVVTSCEHPERGWTCWSSMLWYSVQLGRQMLDLRLRSV